MVEYEASHMESLNKFYMKKNTYDVPSNVRHPENTVVMNTAVMTTAVMNTAEMISNVMNHNSGYLNKSHQVQKKALQYRVKTSSDADATQDQDLARVEGLHPREGITRHHALPVPPRAAQDVVRPAQPLLNLIAAGKVIIVFTT